MAERILGEAGSRRRKRWLVVPILLVAAVSLFWIAGAMAVHDTGKFQLDGNAQTSVQSNPTALEDWDKVCPTTSPISLTCQGGTTASRSTFIADGFLSASDNIFKGGTDDADISGWLWKQAGMSPDKADIEQAFAAQYTVTTAGPYLNHKVLFFGGTRLANDGNTNIGLWFFQNPVTAGGNKAVVDPTTGAASCTFNNGCGFTGVHKPGNKSLGGTGGGLPPNTAGDIFILSAFTNGGAQPTIKVFEWVGPGNATKDYLGSNGCFTSACTLQPLAIPNTPGFNDNRCDTGGPTVGDVACALVNGTPQPSPWLFTDKTTGAPANTFGPSEFYEGGLDLSGLGFGEACFSSVLLNTRSSQSGTSVLQDFALGSFGSCTTDVKTTPKAGDGTTALTADTDNDNLDEISIGTGSVSVKDSALLDVKGVSSFAGTMKFFICGPISNPTACTTGGVPAGTITANANGTYTSDAVNLTKVGRYCWRAEFSSTTNGVPAGSDSTIESAGPPKSTGECFEVMPVQPGLDTTGGGNVAKGSAVTDSATLSGTTKQPGTNGANATYPSINATNGAAAGGKITFTLVNSNCLTTTTGGTGTNPQDVTTISGNGTYGPVSYTPAATGTYHWKASYTPAATDVNNLSASHNALCDDADETVKVVDAKISIAPSATNAVGQPHTFTVTVQQDDGSGTGFAAATVGNVDVTLTDSNGAVSVLDAVASSCDDNQPTGDNLDGSGQCVTTFTSQTAGQVTGHATVGLSVAGVSLTRQTNNASGNSGDAVKTFVDARISIAPNATNEVKQPHTFTVTVTQNDGLTAAQGGDGVNGFTAATVGNVDVTLTDSNGAASVLDGAGSSCDDNQPTGDNLDNSGQCTTKFTSNTAGQVTGHATVNLTVGGVALTRQTNGLVGNSVDAVKTFVDAFITIGPDATNTVGDPHTFTVTVKQDDGLTAAQGGDGVTGPAPAPNGKPVTVTLTDTLGAAHETSDDNCASPGTSGGTGTCSVTFTSPTAGTVTGHAKIVFAVGGVTLTRETDNTGSNSDDAVKIFVAGSIQWTKVDNNSTLQGGATFRLCKTGNFTLPFGPIVDITPVCDDILDNSTRDTDKTDGEFMVEGLSLGRYTVHEQIPPAGWVADPKTETVELTPGDVDKVIEFAFVNSRPILKITGFGYANEPVGAPTSGVTHGKATYTVNLHNYGTADAVLTGSSLVVSNNATCTPGGNTLALTGTIGPGANGGPFTLVCEYNNPANPLITADLTVQYVTGSVTRDASGSPAKISFTVQGD